MNSPTITQFTEAVQNPGLSLHIPQLPNPIISRNKRGQPLVWAGNFAAVYQLQSNQSTWALRCFTTPPNGKQIHYTLLYNALQNRNIPCLSPFFFHQEGILVSGRKFPVITMEWINGLRLDAKVQQLLNRPRQLRTLATGILGAAQSLEANAIAHNDLQHANIIVQNDGDIKLVDYDAFYLPEYQGRPTPEAGHPNYQHPRKSLSHFSPRSDRFPALVILLSLQALAADPSLWKFHNQDNLIFTRQDFLSPQTSQALNQTALSPDPDVRNLVGALIRILAQSPDDAPSIGQIATAQPPAPNRANQRLQPATARSGNPTTKPLIICTNGACGTARISGPCPNCATPASRSPKPNPTPLTHTARTAAVTPIPATNRIAAATPPQPAKILNHPHIARIPPVNPPSARIPRKRIQIPILPVIAVALIILIFIALAAGCAQRIIPEHHSLHHTGHPNRQYAAAPAHHDNPHRHQPASPQIPPAA